MGLLMSRETLKNFLNAIGKRVEKIDYVIDPESGGVPPGGQEPAFDSGDDLGVDPNTGLPLIADTSSITGDYVKYLTDTIIFILIILSLLIFKKYF